jgi:telomere length regulation protein
MLGSRSLTNTDISSLSFALTKCLRAGLLNPPTPASSIDPRPSFFTPIFPSLLRHLSTDDTVSARNGRDVNATDLHYAEGFWPTLLSELQASDIGALAWSFLLHLSKGIHSSTTPNRDIKQAAEYLERFLGPPVEPLSKSKGKQKAGSGPTPTQRTTEIWDSVLETLLMRGKGRESGGEEAVEIRCRIIVCWAAKGGDIGKSSLISSLSCEELTCLSHLTRLSIAIKSLIERVMETWCDPKSVKYSLFAWQLCKFRMQILIHTLRRSYRC